MKTRAEIARFIEKQFYWRHECQFDKNGASHYGKCEVRELLDFIFDGPPRNSEEEVKMRGKDKN